VLVPVMDRVVVMDVKILKEEVVATAASMDLQTVNSKVALNYHVDPEKLADLDELKKSVLKKAFRGEL
jgi:hypothetical protein